MLLEQNFIMKKIFLVITLALIYSSVSGQNSRITSLGEMTIALEDHDLSLDLYDFGNNPAWLIYDETSSWLKILPSVSNNSGAYRRKFDYEKEQIYNIGFAGLKTLGSKGTFLGIASYGIENRKNVYRSLKYNTYSGEASFFSDTTTGDFLYSGPKVGFMYSLELAPDLTFGVSANYQLLDGLKEIYSNAKTIYRDVNGSIGIAYILTDHIVLGLNFELFDSQETIECKNLESLDVEVFCYRGESIYIRHNSSSMQEKVRKKGITFIPQICLKPVDNLELAVQSSYSTRNTLVYNSKGGTLTDVEDCSSDFKDLSFSLKARYRPAENFTAGLSMNYAEYDNWSKNSSVNLLTWEWNVKQASAGVGISYKINPTVLIAAEYQIGNDKADSSKYIDYRFNKLSSTNHIAKIGTEINISEILKLRAGYSLGSIQHDILVGGKDVFVNTYSFGSTINFSKFDLNLSVSYTNKKSDDNLTRSYLGAYAELMLFTF